MDERCYSWDNFQLCGDVQSQWLSENCHLQCQMEYPVCDYLFIDSFHALCFHDILQYWSKLRVSYGSIS